MKRIVEYTNALLPMRLHQLRLTRKLWSKMFRHVRHTIYRLTVLIRWSICDGNQVCSVIWTKSNSLKNICMIFVTWAVNQLTYQHMDLSTGYIRSYLEYVVWYRVSDAAEWRTMKMLSQHRMEATITNLLPGREYEFMVLSQDRYGDGMFSKAFRYWTKREKKCRTKATRR